MPCSHLGTLCVGMPVAICMPAWLHTTHPCILLAQRCMPLQMAFGVNSAPSPLADTAPADAAPSAAGAEREPVRGHPAAGRQRQPVQQPRCAAECADGKASIPDLQVGTRHVRRTCTFVTTRTHCFVPGAEADQKQLLAVYNRAWGQALAASGFTLDPKATSLKSAQVRFFRQTGRTAAAHQYRCCWLMEL